jgi:hypothetical protein
MLRLLPRLLFLTVLSACDDVYRATVARNDRVQVTVSSKPSTASVSTSKSIEVQIDQYIAQNYRKCWIEASRPAGRTVNMPSFELQLRAE